MRENTDRLVCMHDLMKGVVSDEMTELLTDSEVGPEELYRAVLSSNVSLQDKELKLGFVAELADGDDELRAKAGRARKVIRDALAKLGAFPGVVWFMRARDGESRYICEELLLSPDSAKPWRTLYEDGARSYLFEKDPCWVELWRMTPTESGRCRPDYVYYLYDSSPIFFGKVRSDPLYGFSDHGILFDHPEGFTADSIETEYFCEHWVPSKPLPFEVGDMVEFDLRPFGPLRTACVIGDQDGHVTTEGTTTLYRDYISDGWRLASLSDLERELQGSSCESASSPRPSSSIYGRMSSASTSGLPEEDDLMQVRGYLLEREGFADRRARRSVCLQRDWEFSFGSDGLVSDKQLAKLLQGDGCECADDAGSVRLL